jgi:hypothetical protein
MAFVTPTDVATGEVLTASRYNQDVVENFTQLDPLFSAWTAYTPVWTNLTVGNGTNTGRYLQVGKAVVYQGQITWGSTTSATGSNTTVSLPVTAATVTGLGFQGSGYINDAGSRFYMVNVWRGSATTALFVHSESGGAGLVTGTAPMTWATSDALSWQLMYEAA